MDAQTITHNLGGAFRNGSGQAPCPVCQPERRRDQNALSIKQRDGRLLLYCFKQRCSFVEIANAANLPLEGVQVDIQAQARVDAEQARLSGQTTR